MGDATPRVVEAAALVAIPAGWFLMGSPEGQGQAEERPVHRVWADAFEMGRCQVTNREYARFLEATGRRPPPFWNQPEFCAPEQAVAGPSWFAAVAYCEWLSRETGEPYRLPTEAEWERARSGRVRWPPVSLGRHSSRGTAWLREALEAGAGTGGYGAAQHLRVV